MTSSTNITNVNASGQENLTASNLASSCTASETGGVSGTTTVTGGTLVTDNGDSDTTNTITDHPATIVAIPTNPDPNTPYEGHVHIGNQTDTFTYVFNEQTVNADGSITVNAVHEYLHGPLARGNLILGQVVCGVTTALGDTTPPDTTIDSGPSGTTSNASPSFTFSSSEAGSTFECKLDGPGGATGSYGSCTSPKDYTNLAGGDYTFSVRATDAASNTDATPATRSFTVDTTPASAADLRVVLSDSPDPVAARGELTYTVDVTNNGPDTASGVTVLTRAPGTRFVSASDGCTVVKGKNAGISCDLGDIASGDTKTVTIVVKAGRKSVTATSTVSSSTSDPDSGNNTDTETTGIQ